MRLSKGLGGAGLLGQQFGKIGNLAIALDQGRSGADAGDQPFMQAPDGLGDGGVMTVDQQGLAPCRIVAVAG